MHFKALGSDAIVVTKRMRTPVSDFLNKSGLFVFLEKDTLVVPPGILLRVDRELPPYDPSSLQALDWKSINIRKESQGQKRDADSIQAHMVAHLKSLGAWDIVIDDDGTGEIADIIAIRLTDDEMLIHLVHCKFSTQDTPGARVEDMYDVCGQAQKSARWKRSPAWMFRQLIRREKNRQSRFGRSGRLVGDPAKLYEMEEKARFLPVEFRISVAQPGLSKARVSAPILELLASVDVYLRETALATFDVFCNA
jgi:hypothetical protein